MPFPSAEHNRRYGQAHRRLRAQWTPAVRTGHVRCWRCGHRILPRQPWDLGHADDGHTYRGPEHTDCNRATKTHGKSDPDPRPRPRTQW